MAELDELFKEGLTMTPGYMADYLTKHGVTVQKHGRWEKHGYKWKCSACGDVVNIYIRGSLRQLVGKDERRRQANSAEFW